MIVWKLTWFSLKKNMMLVLHLVLLLFFKPRISDGKVFDPCKLFSIFEDHFEKNQINDCMYNLLH